MGLVALWHVGSSQTRARTRVPYTGRQILNHCTTREALQGTFKKQKAIHEHGISLPYPDLLLLPPPEESYGLRQTGITELIPMYFKVLGTSLVIQWLRIRLATLVRSLGTKIPPAVGKLSPCATTREPVCHN